MIDVDLNSASHPSYEHADRIVGESEQLRVIRTTIHESGMNPIWVHLIKQFGSVMFLKGRERNSDSSD